MDVITTTPAVVTFREGVRRVRVFLSALDEIGDVEIKRNIRHMIRTLARELESMQGLNDVEAIEYAAEIIAALVWHKFVAPKKERSV